jgi:hypothetical protein
MVNIRKLGGRISLYQVTVEASLELTYDLYNIGVRPSEIGTSIGWEESLALVTMIAQDTNTYTHAKLLKWKYPVSREYLAMADLYDLTVRINSKKKDIKPYPRPFKYEKEKTNKIGNVEKLSKEEVLKKLRLMNPNKE